MALNYWATGFSAWLDPDKSWMQIGVERANCGVKTRQGRETLPPYILGELDRCTPALDRSSRPVGGCSDGGKEVEGGGGGGRPDEAPAPSQQEH